MVRPITFSYCAGSCESVDKGNVRLIVFFEFTGAVGTTVYIALEKGFDDLMDLCDVVTDKFTVARDGFAAKQRV